MEKSCLWHWHVKPWLTSLFTWIYALYALVAFATVLSINLIVIYIVVTGIGTLFG